MRIRDATVPSGVPADTLRGMPSAPSPRGPGAGGRGDLQAASVLHVIAPGAMGGAEAVVRQLAVAQRSAGMRVAVAPVIEPGAPAPFVDALREASLAVHPVAVRHRAYLTERRRLAAICAEFAPDVVHSHGYRTDVVDAAYLQRRAHRPVVTTVHGFTGGDLRNQLYQWLQCRAYRVFDGVAVVAQSLRDQLASRVADDRLHLIPNAYHPGTVPLTRDAARAALGLPEGRFVIGWVGRLSREKGIDIFLDALASLATPECLDVSIVGDGPEMHAARRRAARLGVADQVTWHGQVADAARLFAAFDLLVLSSRTEGTPMVLLEAMAARVPIVATRVGGVPDLLPYGTALLVPPGSPAELARAIRRVFVEPAGAAVRAHSARTRLVRAYDTAAWVERYAAMYRSACSPPYA